MQSVIFIILFSWFLRLFSEPVSLGVDVLFDEGYYMTLRGKTLALVTNQTGVNKHLAPTSEVLRQKGLKLKVIFSPEHGLKGAAYANEKVFHENDSSPVVVYSLYGETRRPTTTMLEGLDVIIYDIQDIGVRAYTYATTLFYVMEEAAKKNIEVLILDRPNPMGGLLVDGPMLQQEFRSYIGYANVPYCHGMTIGELAKFFNEEYALKCKLKVIPMKGWKRSMVFSDTSLTWVPPSPHIPESDTPFFSASTGMLGEIELVNIGVGYTLPFKVVGAEWIDAEAFAKALNQQRLPGVLFTPFHYKPFYGSYKGVECHGVLIVITDPKRYKPLSVQFALLGMIKSLYPKEFDKKINALNETKQRLFCLASGTDQIFNILKKEKYVFWKLLEFDKKAREVFLQKRDKYLIADYRDKKT